MEAYVDPEVHEIICQCSAQSAKTETQLGLVCWAIAEDPGSILWVTVNEEQARLLVNDRVEDTFKRTVPVANRMPSDRFKNTTLKKFFKGSTVVFGSAQKRGDLESTPYRRIFLDEARQYDDGVLEAVDKRLRASSYNSKKVIISTPAREDDFMDRAFKAGDQRVWVIPCQCCGGEFSLFWGDINSGVRGGLKWDEVEGQTMERGKPIFDEVIKTLRFECPHCDHDYRHFEPDSPERIYFATAGRWHAKNPNASKRVRSYHWNALLPPWASWENQVKEYFTVVEQLEETGQWLPYFKFVTETQGRPFKPSDQERTVRRGNAELMRGFDVGNPDGPLIPHPDRPGDYLIDQDTGAPVDPRDFKEEYRIMTTDVQLAGHMHFYSVIRAWSAEGWSRKLFHHKSDSLNELRELQRTWKVPDSMHCIDAGKPQRRIIHWCSQFGWIPFKGKEGLESYTVPPPRRAPKKMKRLVRLYSKTDVDPIQGVKVKPEDIRRVRPIKMFMYAKQGCQDVLDSYLRGYGEWQADLSTDSEYWSHMYSWKLSSEVNMDVGKKRNFEKSTIMRRKPEKQFVWLDQPDHYYSCELMQIVAADLCGLPIDYLGVGSDS